MRVFSEIFSTDVGMMSLAVIVITIAMAGFYANYFLKHMKEDEARAKAGKP